MTIRSTLALGVSALALFLFTPLARADVMTFDGIGLADNVKVHAPGHLANNLTTEAGQYLVTYNGNQYAAWCVDIDAYAGTTSVTEQSYTVLPNAYAVAYLYETYAGGLTNDTDAAALGVSIWEVITESVGGPFNIHSGSFWITNNGDVASRAASMLATIPGSYTPQGALTVLHSECKQDMLIGNGLHQAPEPGTLVLLAAGGALAAARRRRRA